MRHGQTVKRDRQALAVISGKVDRAHEHLATIKEEIAAYQRSHAYGLAPEVDAKGAQYLLRLRYVEPIPTRWSVLLGEAVHDLRSALDHAVYQLSRDWTGRVVDDTQFPVFSRRKRFEGRSKKAPQGGASGSGLYQIRGVGPGPRAFIEKLQPYPQRSGSLNRSVANLQDLWNQDKHRLTDTWGVVLVPGSKLSISTPPGVTPIWSISASILHDGAIAARVLCDPPNLNVQMYPQFTTDIGIKRAKRRRTGASYWVMFWDVARIVRCLMDALGHQDDPIALPESPPHGSGALDGVQAANRRAGEVLIRRRLTVAPPASAARPPAPPPAAEGRR